jgi:CRISPR-associated endonuclease/helicase Cas3
VAAVADVLLHRDPSITERVATKCGWPVGDFIQVVVFLVALHDIGKFSRSFQAKAPDHWPASLRGEPSGIGGIHHDALGFALLIDDDDMLDAIRSVFPGWADPGMKLLLGAIAGHHGRPVQAPEIETRDVCSECRSAARDFVAALVALLRPPALAPSTTKRVEMVSWWLAGLTTLCDWIGSASLWFPYVGDAYGSLSAYWPDARKQAEKAVSDSGLLPVASAAPRSLRDLLPFIDEPTPMQALAQSVALPDGPVCIIIEDATGSGKTEASLMLVHRLMKSGRGDGVFVALPTMATADAMFDRLARSYRRLFADGADPSLALAHGRAMLNTLFCGGILPKTGAPADEVADDAETASVQCAAWLAEERRRAFFAHVGVGTIDQALLGVLAARHAALRLFGLSRKILLIDEVHAYDPYMAAELDRLLTFHAMLGGSAILLSATLPRQRRVELLEAFARGSGTAAYQPIATDYPLLTIAAVGSGGECHAPMREALERTLAVRRLATADAAVDALVTAARAGACGIWVRNTVDDALAGALALRAVGIAPILFHARFAMGDRLAIQNRVLHWFGKQADPQARAPGGVGRVLVATQVVEQSLDLDADVMVSDLAPIELLIQRAGRLQRHPKRVRPAGFERPELLVLAPEPVALPDADWAADAAIGATRFVYPAPILWRSARVLFAAGAIDAPGNLRRLVEAVYGADAQVAPPGLLKAEADWIGKTKGQHALARYNLLEPARGYMFRNGEWASDIVMPTRLGDDYTLFRMARVKAGTLVPFCADSDSAYAWASSEIALRRSIAQDAAVPLPLVPVLDRLRAGWPRWQREMKVLVMLPDGADGWITEVLRDRSKVRLRYTAVSGLAVDARNDLGDG